jgi:hypothetical protein
MSARQQRVACLLSHPLFQHEQQRHGDQRQVVMPGLPASGLVVAHADLPFGVLKLPLDPVALALHPRQSLDWRVRWCVAEAVLDLLDVSEFPPQDQVPVARLRFASVPQPDLLVEYLNTLLPLLRPSSGMVHIVQRLRQGGVVAVESVRTDPGEADALAALVADHL